MAKHSQLFEAEAWALAQMREYGHPSIAALDITVVGALSELGPDNGLTVFH